ncbi:alpha/beta hydrolase [Streptomyces sp. ME02-8801-2C]|uniref:alpha/beta hydrolase n=1 Tax=Streptomyces sp. ME02-8801-2C TaxID=3028680 RepID=UPI0029BEB4E6|nr:alpha/beta hydrolase [Streptomyces sp. ME02-8801-2C]MDX3453827.1 alpha/beta hydrolase [Streptomyces sp. ME02-8801-2C]
MRTDDGRSGPPAAGPRPSTSVRLDAPQGEEVRWEDRLLDAGTHTVPVRVYRPGPSPYGWLVWAHGGSWQAGSVEHWHEPVMDLARVSGCTVVSAGYRLAPRQQEDSHVASSRLMIRSATVIIPSNGPSSRIEWSPTRDIFQSASLCQSRAVFSPRRWANTSSSPYPFMKYPT